MLSLDNVFDLTKCSHYHFDQSAMFETYRVGFLISCDIMRPKVEGLCRWGYQQAVKCVFIT